MPASGKNKGRVSVSGIASRRAPGAALVVLACAATLAHAQQKSQLPGSYPNKPIRMVVGIPPGGGVDTVVRAVAQKLTDRWGRSIIVDNRPGAGGAIAMDLVAQASADGYTLLGGSVNTVASATPLKKVTFDTRKAYAPIVQMNSQPYVLAVNPSLPVNSVKELIAYAKSKPGVLNYASTGIGSASHLGMEFFKSLADSYALFAPARTPQAIVSALNHEVGEIVNVPEIQKRLAADGVEPAAPNSPSEFKDLFAKEVDKLEKFLRTSGIKL